jgi:SAM-dependent methyltransferase
MPRLGKGYLGYTYYRRLLDQRLTQASESLTGLALDLGGEWHSRRGTFRPPQRADLTWMCVNIDPAVLPDVLADVGHVPFADTTARSVICTDVLEHVPDPESIVVEAYRILKPGGLFVLSMPFIGYVHADPYDFQRYTAHKLDLLLSEAGFQDIEIQAMGHYYTVLCEMLKGALARLRPALLRWMLAVVMIPIMNWMVSRELRPGYIASAYMEGYTEGYFVKAHKP